MPSLPRELGREIVEVAVRTNHPDAIVKLKLSLSSRVDKVFYESITIKSSPTNLKPAGFFATTVKSLSLPALDKRILAACAGAQTFAFVP
ncbi:hypothetical protein B0H16DRAFT_1724677 [Mycena metata]|uniref:Uncharacterized protein n=1 Tax=Mycena metata TaxID=1033252 RepID=A0AAD7ITN0_9AGAR|nr:hypothetical protein B0H16DRAFT_1724677 [Mycena metata]